MVKDHKELIQSGEEAIFDGNVKVDFANVTDGNRLWKIGEIGIARWANDTIWYNAKIENVNVDGSLDVLFVDYGNIDSVKMPFFVKNTSMIEETGEEISLKRLIARPIATLSIDAQESHERKEKIYRDE